MVEERQEEDPAAKPPMAHGHGEPHQKKPQREEAGGGKAPLASRLPTLTCSPGWRTRADHPIDDIPLDPQAQVEQIRTPNIQKTDRLVTKMTTNPRPAGWWWWCGGRRRAVCLLSMSCGLYFPSARTRTQPQDHSPKVEYTYAYSENGLLFHVIPQRIAPFLASVRACVAF